MMAVPIRTEPEMHIGEPQLLFERPTLGRFFDVAPDGERFIIEDFSTLTQINLVLNWFDELKRLVPTN
jgi:hypothetical protein